MASQGPGRKRTPNRNAVTPEEDALNVIAREAEARLVAKRAARAEAREIRMKELERQQKEIYQVQKKYYGLENLDNKWGDIEQWMEDSERYTRHSQRHVSLSDDEECMSVGSRSSVRLDLDSVGAQAGLSHTLYSHSHKSTKKKKKKSKHSSDINNGYNNDYSTISSRGSLYENSLCSNSLRSSTRTLSEYSGHLGSSSRTSSRASSRCASPVLDDSLDRDFFEKGSSRASTLSNATLTSLGGASSRKGSGSSSVTADTEASIQDIKEIHELKDQIHDVEAKYMQSLKEIKDSLADMEGKYRKAMVSNAQLDNEKSNLMYEVDTLKDSLMELEELLAETRRECEEKSKDLEREKHAHSILQFQFSEQKEALKQSEELLTEIRHLHIKQEGFVREISDLQETIEWKDKKIGALERQKEFSDAIRNERDELRDEVVQLKDILRKHGIVLGPDLRTNGEVEENVTSGSACTELQQGSSVLGTQELQLFRGENVGGSRGGQFQHPKDFDHGIQENHLPTSASGNSSESLLVAQNDDVGLGNDINNSTEKIQINVEKPQNVFVVEAEEHVVLEISKGNVAPEPVAIFMDGMRTDQQESSLYVKRSETIKEGNTDSTEKSTCEISEKDGDHLDETVAGDSQIRMVSDSLPSAKIDTSSHSQSASVSGKKKKKKKKSKQKQKHSCDEKEVHSEIGDKNENQLIESSSVQTVESVSEYNSIRSEEATINEKVSDNVNINERTDLMHKGAESLELQSPNTGPGNILGPIINWTDCTSSTDSIPPLDSKTEINIEIPTYGFPLEITTGELNASNGKYKLLSNTDDAGPKDIVAVCADFPDSENSSEVNLEKDITETTKDVVKIETVDEIIHLDETSVETSTDTQLDDTLDPAEVLKEEQETSRDTQLGDTLDTAEVPKEEQETDTDTQLGDKLVTAEVSEPEQETSTDTELGNTLDTAEVPKEEQETSTDTQLGDTLVTAEVPKEEQETDTDTQLGDKLVTAEVPKEEQETDTELGDTLVTAEVPKEEQETSRETQLGEALVTAEVPEQEQETSTDTQLGDTLVAAEVPKEEQETDTELGDTLVTAEVPKEEQETSTDTQLGDTLVTAEVPKEEQETDTELGDTLVTAEVPKEEQETSTDTQLGDTLDTAKVPKEEQETSTDTQLGDTLVTAEVPKEEQETSRDIQLGEALVTAEVPEQEQETSTDTQLGDTLDTAEVPKEEQETSIDTQLGDTLVTAEVPKEEQETSRDTQLGEALVTAEVPEQEQETSTDTQLGDTLDTAKVPKEEQETSTDTELGEALVTAEVPKEEQETSRDTQLGDTLVTAEVPEQEQESQEPTRIDQEFSVEEDEGEVESGESFEFNMEVNGSEGNLLGDTECQQEHKSISRYTEQSCTTSEPQELADAEEGHEDQKLQTDEQNVSIERDKGVDQIATTENDHNKCQQQFITGKDEQGSQDHEEIIHVEHYESAKQEASPANLVQVLDDPLPETGELDQEATSVIPQEEGQNMGEQEIREFKEGTSKRNKEDAKNGSKKESKKGKGKTKEDCKMS
ncbi:titin homolog isoform X4 [Ictalurus furcatus]|uniref:titin homolog isoform X4 n=1 Tax=Ictalurus furcatus TaxID=66913 RepID=UPI002350268D|nr:titin homolog isoform X4 [Ictalurus furcatus]